MKRPKVLPESFRDVNPYVVGLISVAVIGVLVGVAFMIGLLHLLEKSYTVKAVFPDASGLRSGDKIRVAGVEAGRVGTISVDRDNGRVEVQLIVHSNVELGPRTSAEIALETLLGRKYVRLAGPVVKPYLKDEPKAARVIPLERTKTPFDIFTLTTVGTRSIQATNTKELNAFINDLADVTAGKQTDIRDLVTGIDKVSAAVNSREAQLRQLLDQADTLTKTLSDKDQTLVSLIDQSRAILTLLADRKPDLEAAITSGNSAVSELARLITANETNLQRVLDDLMPTLGLLDKHQSDLSGTLAFAGPAQVLQSRTGTHGPWADVFVRAVGPDVVGDLRQALNGKAP